MLDSTQEFFNKMRQIQESLLKFLENENYYNSDFIDFFEKSKIHEEKQYFISFLNLLSKISANHYREPNFFIKIEEIILHYRNFIQTYLSNFDIFNIFKSNKRILLFLIEHKIIQMDEKIINKIITNEKYISWKYPQYFSPEIKPFLNDDRIKKYKRINESINHEWIDEIKGKNELPDDFYNKRKKGENECLICTLIQQDLIQDFIVYINRNNISLQSTFKSSNYETSSFILKKKYETNSDMLNGNYNTYHGNNFYAEISLIEYSAFYGSIQIFNYLRMNGVELSPSLWIYAIHGKNPQIIHILEENHVKPYKDSYIQLFIESIKCHHNDIANYFLDNFIQNFENENELLKHSLKYYNFAFLKDGSINHNYLNLLCKYNYYIPVNALLSNSDDIKMDQYHFDLNNRSALYLAIENENTEIVKLLLTKKNIDINLNNEKKTIGYTKETSLHLAVEKENIEIIKLLLMKKNIDINKFTVGYNRGENEEKTAIHIAVEKENIEIIKLLLMNKRLFINYFKKIKYGSIKKTVLCLAVERENNEIVKLLTSYKKLDINQFNYERGNKIIFLFYITTLYRAIEIGNIEIVKLILNNKKLDINIFNKINSNMKTAFYLAVEKENIDIVKLFLEQSSLDINIKNKERWGIIKHEKDGSSKTIDIANTEKTALFLAVEKENIEIIKLLLSNEKLDINAYNIEYNDFWWETLNGININIQKTALYLAVEKENIEIIILLLENNKINVNILNTIESKIRKRNSFFNQKTALHAAVEKENKNIVRILLQVKNINKNIVDEMGKKPIDYSYNNEIMQLF